MTLSADINAARILCKTHPYWVALKPAGEVLALGSRTILHAGPPLGEATPPAPIVNSAAAAAVFEGWAQGLEEARAMVLAREIELQPAQDHYAVVPLAGVLSPSMWVHVVQARDNPECVAYSPLNGGSGPAIRLGLPGEDVVHHLRWLNGEFAEVLSSMAVEPVELAQIADLGLAEGDDCHGRTIAATRILVEKLNTAKPFPDSAAAFLHSSPSFFLNLWMAASKCLMRAFESVPASEFVTAMGGNGIDFGVQVSGVPRQWFMARADAPTGNFEQGFSSHDALPAIGDSAVIDALGLGAMAMHFAPAQEQALGAFMPGLSALLSDELANAHHPGFRQIDVRLGISAQTMLTHGQANPVALGIIDRAGKAGRIGGGIYVPDLKLFTAAHAALWEEQHRNDVSSTDAQSSNGKPKGYYYV